METVQVSDSHRTTANTEADWVTVEGNRLRSKRVLPAAVPRLELFLILAVMRTGLVSQPQARRLMQMARQGVRWPERARPNTRIPR